MTSCNEDSDTTPPAEENVEGVVILDPADMKESAVIPLTSDELRILRRVPDYFDESWKNGHKEAAESLNKEIKDQTMGYDNMRLLFHVSLPDEARSAYNEEQWKSTLPSYFDLIRNAQKKLSIPAEEIHQYNVQRGQRGEELLTDCSIFFTARLSGNVTITADKDLFGIGAGEDLSAHFAVEGAANCLPQGPLPDYKVLFENLSTSRPTAIPAFFASETWLMRNYMFWMKDTPEEKYDELTFTITLPVICDFWRDYYANKLPEVKREGQMLTASVAVRFNQKSDFETQIIQRGIYAATLWWY